MKLTGETIRMARKACGWPQGKLAKEVGVHPSFISLIEAGYRDIPESKAQAIRDALPIKDAELRMLTEIEKRLQAE
ncbi:helix-turn-helix domain-containing protein [Halobacillus seohaensis]|uniref:Helix-turn-helix domain-containing protein n=1 Tax=Halobacillus seohaensis TaxID=447421 RepID=A0ABW2ERC4_9BACI